MRIVYFFIWGVQHTFSRVIRFFVETESFLSKHLISVFIFIFNIDCEQVEYPVQSYKSLGDFFYRRLKEGARPIGSSPFIHPVDGNLTLHREIRDDLLIQAKRFSFSMEKFLAGSSAGVSFNGGSQLTYYLSPKDYHRVHAFCDFSLEEIVHVPGLLHPVNQLGVNYLPDLFIKNERVFLNGKTNWGNISICLIGALGVGQIPLFLEYSTQNFAVSYQKILNLNIQKGQCLGGFKLGSSVIILTDFQLPRSPLGKVVVGRGL